MPNTKAKYIIVCDESTKKGRNFSYFYGGAMLLENKYEMISAILDDYKQKLNLHELKRVKITEKNYKDYIKILQLFFTFVKSGDIKIRVMFSPNKELLNLPKSQNETYTKFYHAFIINAFNIFYAKEDIELRLIFDDLPETKQQCKLFKKCLIAKINSNYKINTNKAHISRDKIEEVDSKKHTILQCVDIIVGLVDFILNTTTQEIKESKRAKARLNVWNYILEEIYIINSNFDLTQTTKPVYSNKGWKEVYRHFVYEQKK